MDIVKNKLARYLLIKAEIADLEKEQKIVKDELEPYLLEAPKNQRGSHVVEFSESLSVAGKDYKGLQKLRKESRVLNEERTVEWLDQRARDASPDGIPFRDSKWYSPIVTVQHIDHDALWDLWAQDLITQEEFDSFFDITESYSFFPVKE